MAVATKSTQFYSGFTPQVIPGLGMWLDGADPAGNGSIPANGSILSTWADKSGNSNNATAFTGSASYSQKSVVFTGTQSFTTPLSSVQNNQSGFVVVTLTTNTLVDVLGLRYTSGTRPGIQLVFNGETPSIRAWGGTTVVTGSLVGQNTRIIYGYNFIGGGAVGTNFIYSNGTQTGSNTSTSPVLSGVGTVMIGAYTDSPPSAFERFNGSINEVILYSVNLTQSERQQIEGYLALKWGLAASIPATHPYRSIPPFLRALQPTDLSGCVAWYDVADQSMLTFSSGSNVNLVRDKSGNARDISQSVVGQQPLLVSNVIGSNPVLRFTQSSTTVLSNASAVSAALSNGPASFMLLERNMTAPTGNPGPFGFNAGPNFGIMFQFNPGFTGSFQPYTLAGGQTFTSATGRFDYYNRTNTGSGAIGTVYGTVQTVGDNATGTYSGLFNVGRAPNGYISGDIGELIVYNSNLSEADRQRLEGYIGWKWGVQGNLPSTHPFRLYRPLVAVFTPLALPAAALWLDAADTSTITFSSGSNISTWADKSGRGFNATQVNSPTYNSSTRSVTFNSASAQYFTLADNALPAGNSSYAYFIVFSFFGNGAYGLIGGGNYGSGSQVCATRNDGSGKIINYWWAADITTTNTATLNTRQICETFYNAGSSRSVSLNFTGTTSVVPGTRSQGVSNNTVGKTYSTEYHNGTISEIIVYSAQPTFAQQQQVEGYLAWKWGLRSLLPISHPYYEFRP